LWYNICLQEAGFKGEGAEKEFWGKTVKLEMREQMRMEQQMKLAPRMIQSMEILQLPILALQERIERELNSNPVLEVEEEASAEEAGTAEQQVQGEAGEKEADTSAQNWRADRLERDGVDDNYKEYMGGGEYFRHTVTDDEPDRKLEAIKNTAAPPQSLNEYLEEQWRMVEAGERVKKAGGLIIDYIDERGYLTVRLEQLHNKDRKDFGIEDLKKALELVQKLEPTGVGARDPKECLLIQMKQSGEDMGFERRLISEYMDELLKNQLPDIAKNMNCTIERIKQAVGRISKFDTSPGLQIGQDRNHPVSADVIAESDDAGEYSVRLAETNLPNLRVSDYYVKMARDTKVNDKTRDFLRNNIRSARWIMEAIEQRKNTLLKVARAVVKYQKEFFDKGQLYLRPLPMSKVAEEVGVHLTTVSRAVAGKYLQCEWGILPMRKFFSGGLGEDSGQGHSWEAIRGKLQQIIDQEDKNHPLNDDQICEELAKSDVNHIARRTVAKYRGILNIPAARFRRKY